MAVRERHADRDAVGDPRDHIEYIADLLLELKEMALSHRLSTLAGILDLAYAEARLRAKDYGNPFPGTARDTS